jgi:hypothetical protein
MAHATQVKWLDERIWAGYDVNIDQAEPHVEDVFALGFVHARILGRETAHGVRLLLSFENKTDREQFVRDMMRRGHWARRIEPTSADIKKAKPIGEVFPFSMKPVFQNLVSRVALAMNW